MGFDCIDSCSLPFYFTLLILEKMPLTIELLVVRVY